MLNIGCHLSISKGFYQAGLEAVSIGANTFQFFTRNPRGGKTKEIDPEDINKLKDLMEKNNFAPLFAHASYTMNLCSDKKHIRNFSKMLLEDDLKRVEQIPNCYYIFHPGLHVGQGTKKGLELIIDALNEVIKEENQVTILLEGMSGKGSEIGGKIEELKTIIDGVQYNQKLGICIDTCHMYSSGLDIVNDLEGVLEHIDKVVGLDKVKAVHLNDSKTPLGSNNDRHETIGEGLIGLEALVKVITHPVLRNLPFNLETPNDVQGYKKEIQLLREKFKTYLQD